MKEDLLIKATRLKNTKTVIAFYGRFFVISLFLWGCDTDQKVQDNKPYDGPMMRLDSVNTLLTDSAKILLKIRAPREEAFENGDREWKDGLFLEYYDDFGEVSSTFQSDYAYYQQKENLYKGEGNVIVKNTTNGDELNTEELFWDPGEKQFYTERFVTIHTEDEIHTGEGLTANEDFSSYKILKPSGTFTIDQENGFNKPNPPTKLEID